MEISYVIKSYEHLTRDELYDILAARFEVFVSEQKCFYTDPDYIDQKCFHLLGRSSEGRLVGYLRIIPPGVEYHGQPSDSVHIGRVLFVKEARGRGLGQELMQQALDFARKTWNGVDIELSAQVYIKSLYEKCGFEAVGEEYIEADIPHIRMILKP